MACQKQRLLLWVAVNSLMIPSIGGFKKYLVAQKNVNWYVCEVLQVINHQSLFFLLLTSEGLMTLQVWKKQAK